MLCPCRFLAEVPQAFEARVQALLLRLLDSLELPPARTAAAAFPSCCRRCCSSCGRLRASAAQRVMLGSPGCSTCLTHRCPSYSIAHAYLLSHPLLWTQHHAGKPAQRAAIGQHS